MRVLWELRHAIVLLSVIIAVYIVARHHPWVWALLAAIVVVFVISGTVRQRLLFKRRGYRLVMGAEGSSVYEEVIDTGLRKVNIPSRWTEPGRPELFIPDKEVWRESSPAWAASKRDEIFSRVVSVWGGFEIHYPEDWPLADVDKLSDEQAAALDG